MVELLERLGVPTGNLIQTREGKEAELRSLLDEFRRYDFTGAVVATMALEGSSSQAIVAFRDGKAAAAAYVFHKPGMKSAGRLYLGDKAVGFLWEDVTFAEAEYGIVTYLDIAKLFGFFKDGGINSASLIPPSWLPKMPRKAKIQGRGEVCARMMHWDREGYDVTTLLNMWSRDPEQARRALPYFQRTIDRAQSIREAIDTMNCTGFEREAHSILRKLRYPSHVPEAERELELLTESLGGQKRGMKERRIRDQVIRDRSVAMEDHVYDILLRHGHSEPASMAHPAPLESVLDPRFTFESFVEGPSNQFAKAAALAVAGDLGGVYNPLFIFSRSGMGKTHLEQAVGNRVLQRQPEGDVVYCQADLFENGLLEAVAENRLNEFREGFAGCDLLMVDDVQFLAGRERAQEEIIHILNSVVSHGGHVIITSDLLPREIPSLSDRLITRFESGLIIDIQPPDLGTRIAILGNRVRDLNSHVPDEVIEFVAQLCHGSVRELNGSLNRLLAFSSLMGKEVTMDLASEVLSYKAQTRSEELPRMLLSRGHSYLFEEWKPEVSYQMMARKLAEGYSGLAISRTNPRFIRDRLPEGSAQVFWLTDHESDSEETVGPSLERIMLLIEKFLAENDGAVVLIDDVHYLLSNVSFDGFIRFVRKVVDQVSDHNSIFLVSADPAGLGEKERSILEREMEVMKTVTDVRVS